MMMMIGCLSIFRFKYLWLRCLSCKSLNSFITNTEVINRKKKKKTVSDMCKKWREKVRTVFCFFFFSQNKRVEKWERRDSICITNSILKIYNDFLVLVWKLVHTYAFKKIKLFLYKTNNSPLSKWVYILASLFSL